MIDWIKTTYRLPEEGQQCICLRNQTNWLDGNGGAIHHVLAFFRKGLSQEDRDKLPDTDERKRTYCSEDEWNNNLVPYRWEQFGPGSQFGQDISYWAPAPEMPPEFIEEMKNKKQAEDDAFRNSPFAKHITKIHNDVIKKALLHRFET